MESTGSRTATSPSDACARPSRASACALYPARALIPAGCLRRTRAQREGKACWPTSGAGFGEESLDSFLKFRCAIEKVTRGVATRGRSASQSVFFSRTRALLSRRLKTNTSPRCVAFDRRVLVLRRPVVAMPMASFGFKQRLLRERGRYPMIATRCRDPCIPCEPSNTGARSNEPSRRAVTLK